jgi:hypothetical protein
MAKYTLTEEEEERLRELTPEERAEKFAGIEKEINLAKQRIKDVSMSNKELIGEAEAQRKFLASL